MKAHTSRPQSLMAAWLVVAILVGACMPTNTPVPAPPTVEPTEVRDVTDVSDITNIVWQWANVGGPATELQVSDPQSYTITFLPQNQLSIQADCNMVGGIYAAAGDRITIQLGPSTRAFCGEESLDQMFTSLLAKVSTFSVTGDVLLLTTVDGNLLDFAYGGPVQAEAVAGWPPFANALWEWEAFRSPEESMSFTVAEPEAYTAVFAGDSRLVLRADCNRALGSYAVDGASLMVTLGPTTLAECGTDSLYNQYLVYFSDVASYVMEGDRLILNLKMDAGEMMFRRGDFAPGIDITPDQVSVDTQDLPYSWQSNLIAETPYDASMPPGPVGLPEHIQVNFGVVDPADVLPGDPIMYILPVNAYREQWQQAGDDTVTRMVQEIYRNTVALQLPPPTADMPALPPEQYGGVNDVAAQIGRVTGVSEQSAARDGYRLLGRWAQDANPIVNGNLRYVYQGFTNDGKNLVSFWYPVTTPALENEVADLPAQEMDAFNADPQGYITAQVEMLNALAPADFEPSLDTLDALVASLRVEGMPAEGLTGFVWRPVTQAPAPGGTPVAIDDPMSYSVSYYPSGNLSYVADCNVGVGTFTMDGAVTGSIRTQLGPTTLAACSPESWGQTLVHTLMAAQDFRVLPGGNRMVLYMPAGGPVVMFVKAGPAEEPAPEPYPTVVFPTPAPVIPTGRVVANPGLNVRSGPGTNYPIIGFAPFGATGEIVGRSEDVQWWATPVTTSPTGLGWLSAAYVQVSGAEYVPVIVSSPPPPSATATPTRPAPTATIAPTPAAEIAFWADRYQVNQGECARLSWRALNVAAVWVYPQGQPYSNNRKPPEGSQVVCPPVTTTYEMRVEQYDGRVIFQQVTIQVRPIPTPTKVAPTTTSVPPTATRIPPTATPVPPTATKVPPTATPVPPTATPVPPTATSVPSSPLANTSWVVTRFEGFGVPIGNPPTIGFTADNRAEIFGGCNSFQATYSTNGNQIAILVGVGTTMLCGENVDQQETYYIQLLSRAAFYEMPGAELILRDAGGMELLRFARR